MQTKYFYLLIILLFSITMSAQQKTEMNVNTSQSIYTLNFDNKDLNTYDALKKRLGFSAFKFFVTILPSAEFPMSQSFSVPSVHRIFEFKGMKKKPTIYKLDDLKRYQNNRLAREINYKNDPSQWNLHRIENRIQPYFLKKQKNKQLKKI
ncbi:hypothetical protein ATE90_2361 [Polaribacter sp. Hel1_33_96]|jgi:hypothetical protein|nr:hypothetical protein ATE90_2361 [Polaribacter sp. Hel1_33_96]